MIMKLRFVNKKLKKNEFIVGKSPVNEVEKVEEQKAVETPVESVVKNKRKKTSKMDLKDKMAAAEEIMNSMAPEVKVVKKDRGLIERTESSKIILTEDNRQVLND